MGSLAGENSNNKLQRAEEAALNSSVDGEPNKNRKLLKEKSKMMKHTCQ